MGKKIDCFVLMIVISAGFYFYFYRSFRSHTIAFAAALLCCFLLRKTFRHIAGFIRRSKWYLKRKIICRAGSSIMHLACMPEDEAREILTVLMEKEYNSHYPLEVIQLHPGDRADINRIFEAWKAHRSEDKLVICTTGCCSQECRNMASELRGPRVALIDSAALSRLIAEHPENIFIEEIPEKRRFKRFRMIFSMLASRKNAPRCLLFAFSMLVMFVFTGNQCYLISSMLLLFFALASLRRASMPSKLF